MYMYGGALRHTPACVCAVCGGLATVRVRSVTRSTLIQAKQPPTPPLLSVNKPPLSAFSRYGSVSPIVGGWCWPGVLELDLVAAHGDLVTT